MRATEIEGFSRGTSRRLFLQLAAASGVVAGLGTSAVAQAAEITLDGDADGWVGTSPAEIEGETNPTLQLQAGETYTITWTNVDGAPHTIAIADGSGNTLESTEQMDEEGQTQSLEFEATEEMSTYFCEVHPDSMRGEIAFGDASGGATDESPGATEVPISEAFSAGQLAGDEGPTAVETPASGAALFGLDEGGDQLHYLLLVAEIERVTQAHIHVGGADEEGDVVAWLFGLQDEQDAFVGPLEQGVSGSGLLAEGTITGDDLVGPLEGSSLSDLLDQLRAESAYVNVHTAQNPAGEIRGQIGSADSVAVELAERVDAAVDETFRVATQVTLNVTEPNADDGTTAESQSQTTEDDDCNDDHDDDDEDDDNDDHDDDDDDDGEDGGDDDY